VTKRLETLVGNAILGIDTLWGGDVMCASGTGRFIADSWFGGGPLPHAYTVAEAAAVRASGGVSAKSPDVAAIDNYLAQVDIPGAIEGLERAGGESGGLRGEYLVGLALCFDVMWKLAMEVLGRGAPVPYERCVTASTGRPPEPSDPVEKRERVAELLGVSSDLLEAVDGWRARLRIGRSTRSEASRFQSGRDRSDSAIAGSSRSFRDRRRGISGQRPKPAFADARNGCATGSESCCEKYPENVEG